MDYYLDSLNVYNRLKEEYYKYKQLIIAVDFDGTLYDFHNEGHSHEMVAQLLREWRDHAKIIIYTASAEDRYESIRTYLDENNIPYDTINEPIEGLNVPQGMKLYYNCLMDDRCGLHETYTILNKLIKYIKREGA